MVTYWNNKPTAGYLWFWYAVPFKRMLSLRSGGGIIGLFAEKGSCWLGSENVVKASVGSTEENSSWNKRYSSKRRKRWFTQSSLKEIVNFIFNKFTQETRTQLSRLILHKEETPRKRINPKNWLQKELYHNISKNNILSFTKVKLTVGGWRLGFEHVSRISFYRSFFLVIIVEVTALTCRINKNNDTYWLSDPSWQTKVEWAVTQYRTRNTWNMTEASRCIYTLICPLSGPTTNHCAGNGLGHLRIVECPNVYIISLQLFS